MGPRIDEYKFDEMNKNNYNIIKFKTIRYKLTASGKIIHLIPNYKLMRAVSNLRLLKEQKQAKTAQIQEKNEREVSKALKSKLFT